MEERLSKRHSISFSVDALFYPKKFVKTIREWPRSPWKKAGKQFLRFSGASGYSENGSGINKFAWSLILGLFKTQQISILKSLS